VVSFTTRPFYPKGKSPLYPLDRRLGGAQSRSGHGGEEKNSQLLPGLEYPIIRPIARRYTTDIFRLLIVKEIVIMTIMMMMIIIISTNSSTYNCAF
jgi:hypothetical protein